MSLWLQERRERTETQERQAVQESQVCQESPRTSTSPRPAAVSAPRETSAAQDSRPTVLDLVESDDRLYPVGRLDADSEGLILLTNDGELTERLTHPRYESEKEYRVLVKGDPDEERLAVWRRGVVLEGKKTAPALVRREERAARGVWLRVVMHEGRKHQIRDIGELLGMPVMRLVRVRMGPLQLGKLPPGAWRKLSDDEVEQLRAKKLRARPRPRPSGPSPAAQRRAGKPKNQ